MTFRDVRMRGFEKRARLKTVLEWLSARYYVTTTEDVSLERASGRVLAEDVVAGRNVPPFRRSAMDGYALIGEETTGAGDYSPLSFEILGESWPGSPFVGDVRTGTAVRIMTGAPVPDGADAVIPAEQTSETGDRLEITGAVPPGKNIGSIGEDIRTGTIVLQAGRVLRPQDVGILAALGMAEVPVLRRPRVRLLITGNELATPGETADAHQIYDSNSWMLAALLARDGGELIEKLALSDDRTSIEQALSQPGADMILVSGGSSVGAEDHAPSLVAELGTLHFHGIAMRPASPAGVGTVGSSLVFLLPGNPVSCLCAYDLLAGGAIRTFGGRSETLPYPTRVLPVGRKIVSAVGRLDYCRVVIEDEQVVPLAISGASVLSSTSRADGFVLVPEECEGYPVGSSVKLYLYDAQF